MTEGMYAHLYQDSNGTRQVESSLKKKSIMQNIVHLFKTGEDLSVIEPAPSVSGH